MALGVGLVTWWLLPVPFAAAFAMVPLGIMLVTVLWKQHVGVLERARRQRKNLPLIEVLSDALDQDDDILERLDVVVASVHSKLRMEKREMTRRMITAIGR